MKRIYVWHAILNGDYQNVELGNISYKKLSDLNANGFEIDREVDWQVKKAREIDGMVRSMRVF